MYKKSMSVIAVLCLLGMGSVAFGGTFGGPWSFQGDWHNTDSSMCKPAVAVPQQSNDWYDWDNWGMQNNGNNGCNVTLFDNYIFLAIEPKNLEPCVSTWNPAYPGADANGYDLYATQVFVMPWAWEYATAAYRMTIEGGNINCGRMIALAYNVIWPESWNAYPILDVNGGDVYTPGYRNFDANYPYDPCKFDDPCYPWVTGDGLWVGGGDPGTGGNFAFVNIRGTGRMIMPRIRIMNGEVNVFGPSGLLYHDSNDPNMFFISQQRARNHINVEGGELRLKGDRLEQVVYYLSKGRVIPCKGHGDLHVDFNGFDSSVTSTCTPDSAWNPNPIDDALGVALNKTFTWSAGPRTMTVGDNNAHDVYFGTDFNDVNDASLSNHLGVYQTSTDACSFNPGALVMDTNYFWRIDEHNDVTIWKGNTWAFKSKGPQATDPIPGDDAVGLPLPIVLKWNPGAKASGAQAHAVYFGPNEANVMDATIGNPLGCFKGYVADPVYKLSNLNYDLAADTNYYWRIDESNGIDIWKGTEVWHVFNTNYFVAEDFDLYTDNDTMKAKWKEGRVDYTSCGEEKEWYSNGVIDFDFNDGDGAMQFDYDNSYGREFSEVRFDANDGSASGSDWTGGGALPDNDKCKSLAIGFFGNTNNDSDPDYDRMYAAIEDTAGNFGAVLHSEPQAQRTFGWTQWFIDLHDLNDINDVQLAHIKYLYLGFSDRCHDKGFYTAGGTGRVRFDDIRLYQQTCRPQFISTVGDLTGDCKVDLADLDVMANAWLAKQVIIPTVTDPGTTGLRLWYKFDETDGTTITDSSVNGYNGEVNSAPLFADIGQPTTGLWDPTGGFDGGGCFVSPPWAISDFNMSIEANKNALSNTQTSLTLSIWVNGDNYMPLSGWARLICAFQDFNTPSQDENEVLEIDLVPRAGTSSSVLFQAGMDVGSGETAESNSTSASGLPLSAFAGSWQHYAFVRSGADANVDVDANYNKIRIYHNGEMVGDANALKPIFGTVLPQGYVGTLGVESFRLIRRNQGAESWYGKIDDFRVYNRALSQAEVGWLGTKGTGTVPFVNASNLKSSTPEKISFNDFAVLAGNWLTEGEIWPEWDAP